MPDEQSHRNTDLDTGMPEPAVHPLKRTVPRVYAWLSIAAGALLVIALAVWVYQQSSAVPVEDIPTTTQATQDSLHVYTQEELDVIMGTPNPSDEVTPYSREELDEIMGSSSVEQDVHVYTDEELRAIME